MAKGVVEVKKIISLLMLLVFTISICGCGISKTSQDNYSQTAINCGKKAVKYIDDYLNGSIDANKAKLSLEALEEDLDDYITENRDLATTENDKWINGKIDLAKYAMTTEDIPNITQYKTDLEEMIE